MGIDSWENRETREVATLRGATSATLYRMANMAEGARRGLLRVLDDNELRHTLKKISMFQRPIEVIKTYAKMEVDLE